MKEKQPEITPEDVYLSRRRFVAGALVAGAGLLIGGCAGQNPSSSHPPAPKPGRVNKRADERGDRLTTYEAVANYNNFYEFTTDKEGVAQMAAGFKTDPWTIEVGGLARNRETYDVDDLIRKFRPEERVYRMRCVEAWSMVIPWLGFPLRKLIDDAEPLASAKYVRFTSVFDPGQLPGQNNDAYVWPYVEGLRLDEARHPLTLLATGLYGKPLLPQNGAPLRLVVPWKYGYKSAKSIVRIDFVEKMPVSLWMRAAPGEYGFFANVNPAVPHQRWSQNSERRIGEFRRRKTGAFNGYQGDVAALYRGMDLKRFF